MRLEEQLQISEKMASIGLACRRRGPRGQHPADRHLELHADAARRRDPEDPRTRVLEKIERQTFRAAKIVNGLLTLARPTAGERERAERRRSERGRRRRAEPARASVREPPRQGPPRAVPEPVLVVGMEHKLQQVFLNLFLNAKDAMPSGAAG